MSDINYMVELLKAYKEMIGKNGPLILDTGILKHCMEDENEDISMDKIKIE